MRTQISSNVSERTRQQANELMELLNYSLRDVVTIAVDRMYKEEIEMNERTLIRLTAVGEAHDPFNAIQAAIADGNLPSGAHMGGWAQTPQGHFPKPENAVGTIRVGYKTQYWIVVD